MCSGSEEGSDLRLIDFVYHPTLGLRVIRKKKNLVSPRHRLQQGLPRLQCYLANSEARPPRTLQEAYLALW